MNQYQSQILMDKNGLVFSKCNDNHYNLSFSMNNQNIRLCEIINFDLIKLIYDLNPDIYENSRLEKYNDNEACLTLLMKNLFEDLGLPQKYTHVFVTKTVTDSNIIFVSKSIKNSKPDWVPRDAELMAVKNMTSNCKIVTPHLIDFTFDIIFEDYVKIPQFMEKMICIIINKIFIRVKQFIENINVK
jgi:hypothetical protein